MCNYSITEQIFAHIVSTSFNSKHIILYLHINSS